MGGLRTFLATKQYQPATPPGELFVGTIYFETQSLIQLLLPFCAQQKKEIYSTTPLSWGIFRSVDWLIAVARRLVLEKSLEEAKFKKYEGKLPPEVGLIPLVVTKFGAWEDDAHSNLKKIVAYHG